MSAAGRAVISAETAGGISGVASGREYFQAVKSSTAE